MYKYEGEKEGDLIDVRLYQRQKIVNTACDNVPQGYSSLFGSDHDQILK